MQAMPEPSRVLRCESRGQQWCEKDKNHGVRQGLRATKNRLAIARINIKAV